MISIIVPVYKAENFLERCVRSILAQSNPDWELLLIDDGSPDRSGAICDIFAKGDKRITVIHKENGGVSTARNLGLDNSKGEWICFIDADDYISNNYCEAIIGRNEDIVIVERSIFIDNGTLRFAETNTSLESYNNEQYKSIICHHLTDNRFKAPWGKFIKREVADKHRFKIGQKIGEDTKYMYDVLATANTISIRNGYTYFWYQNSEGDFLKYMIDVDTAIDNVKSILESYKKIGVESIACERLLITYFFSLIDKRKYGVTKKWFTNDTIQYFEKRLKIENCLPSSYTNWITIPIVAYILYLLFLGILVLRNKVLKLLR